MKNKQLKASVWKRVAKGIGIISGIFILAITLLVVVTTIVHQKSLKSEAGEIESYGKKIAVFDGEMNIVDEGKGEKTIILLPGQGTASPYLDFKPLIAELKKNYRVVTIEPFGYGLSSQTNRPRTISNYLDEIHEVTKQLELKKYTIMGHSIAGLYGVNYAQKYSGEMESFIGIDTSTPEQPWPGVDMRFFDFLKEAGVFRALIAFSPETTIGVSKNNPDFRQLRLLTLKNMSSRNMKEELQELNNSFPQSKGLIFPKELPVLLFVAKNQQTMEGWLALHQDQIEGLEKGKVIELEGKHYLHHTQTPRIAKEVQAFIENNQ